LSDVVGKFLGLQVTGGASTVSDAYEKMRVAGAVAREVLLTANGHHESRTETRNGTAVTPDGMSLSYASLAVTVAKIDPPATITIEPESERRFFQKTNVRLNMVAKCTGTAISASI
jgi:isoquinoline 1-oxidoreductase subunit beta